jgi:hypothetical protein
MPLPLFGLARCCKLHAHASLHPIVWPAHPCSALVRCARQPEPENIENAAATAPPTTTTASAPTAGLGLVAYGSDSDDPSSQEEDETTSAPQPIASPAKHSKTVSGVAPADETEVSTTESASAAAMGVEKVPTSTTAGPTVVTAPAPLAVVAEPAAAVPVPAADDPEMDSKLADFFGELQALETDQAAVGDPSDATEQSDSPAHPTEEFMSAGGSAATSDGDEDEATPTSPPAAAPRPDSPDRSGDVIEAADESTSTKMLREALEALKGNMGMIGISTQVQGITKWHIQLIKLGTRFEDYRAGMLSARYVHSLVREAADSFAAYTASLAPGGWQCMYDKASHRYFYLEKATGKTSWQYPTTAVDAVCASGVETATPAQPPLPPDDADAMSAPPLPPDDPPAPDEETPPPIPADDPPPLPDDDDPPPQPPSSEATPVDEPTAAVPVALSTAAPPAKKRRKTKGTLIAKDKKMSKLVAKWSQVQEKAKPKPPKPALSVDARRDRDIEKWKAEQMEGDGANKNPNFTPIAGDWRKRREKRLQDDADPS